MNRLTKRKNHYGDYTINEEAFSLGEDEYQCCINALGWYEDFENKLGCSIALYYKMCIEGTELYSLPHLDVIQWKHKYIYHKDFEGNAVFCLMLNSSLTPLYYVKDYGKTWALTRKELENDK